MQKKNASQELTSNDNITEILEIFQECNNESYVNNIGHDIFCDQFQHDNFDSDCTNEYNQVFDTSINVNVQNENADVQQEDFLNFSKVVCSSTEVYTTEAIYNDCTNRNEQISDITKNVHDHNEIANVENEYTLHYWKDVCISSEDYTAEDETAAISSISTNILNGLDLKGRRIVDVHYLLQSFIDLYKKHSLTKCSAANINATESVEKGLGTKIFFECTNCKFQQWISSEQEKQKSFPINKMSVLATVVTGTGYEGLKQLCAGMNISCMAPSTYIKLRKSLVPIIEQAANDEMKKAGAIERQIAIDKGHIINGIPWIEVEGDGGYGKRSYRSGKHDSLLCVGVIIGVETKKVLSVEVRQKFCLTCFKAAKLNRKPRAHRCFKNWSYKKSSSSMETDCILKSFQKSVETHNLIYKTYIGDGDSGTYNALIKNDVYGKYGVRVGRLYCYNHLFRNMCNKIVDASKMKINRYTVSGNILKFREFIKKSAFRVRKTIMFHTNRRIKQNCPQKEKVKELQRDILNVVNHVYGQHKHCKSRGLNCTKRKNEKNWIPVLKACRIYDSIEEAVKKISCFTESLLRKVTTNAAENFNSRIAKYIDGKRTNHAFADSYYIRCFIGAIQYNTGSVYGTLSNYIDEDFDVAIDVEAQHQVKILQNKLLSQSKGKKKRTVAFKDEAKEYGDNHQEPDVSNEVFDELVRNHFQQLKTDRDNRDEIERNTIKQNESDEWYERRRNLLTASKFGVICKLKDSTSCAGTVESILYPIPLDLPQLRYGHDKEKVAIPLVEKKLKVKIEPAGLLIDIEKPYLGASLDGKIGEDGMIEIKSPYTARELTPMQAIKQIKHVRDIFHPTNVKKLNRNHSYYYQVQGCLHVSQRKYCLFILYTPKGIHIVREEYDRQFWNIKMEPKLTRFYMECLLPEIVDSRVRRNMPIKDPTYILKAKNEKDIRVAARIAKKELETNNNVKQVAQKKKSEPKKIDLTVIENENMYEPYYSDGVEETHAKVDLKSSQSTIKKNSIITKMRKQLQKMSDIGSLKRNNMDQIFNFNIKKSKKISNGPHSALSNEEGQKALDVCNSSININQVISNIMAINDFLLDDVIETFMKIVRRHLPDFEIHVVQHFVYIQLLKPASNLKHIQIVGGNQFKHWICVFFNGCDLFIYDSLNRLEYDFLHEEEKQYLRTRYHYVNSDDIIFVPVTRQPDSVSCGVYAAAFVTEIAFGTDPSMVNYSLNASLMRQHLVKVISERTLQRFPRA